MIKSLIIAVGDPAIELFREINDEMKMPKIFMSNRSGENVFNLPTNLIYIIESEKISTEYDDKFKDIMENFMFYDHYFLVSDIGDEFSISASRAMGKIYGGKCTPFFIYPFSFEGGNRRLNADSFLKQVSSFFPRYLVFRNDYIFRVFPGIPMRVLPRVRSLVIYRIIENISDSLDPSDIENMGSGEIGFGISVNERMDRLGEDLEEAMGSPWIPANHQKAIVIFNGNITEEDVWKVKERIRYKEYLLRLKKRDRGREIYITVITH